MATEAKSLPPCLPSAIMEVTHAIEKTEMIYNAGQLRLFDRLAENNGEPMSSEDLGKLVGVHEDSADDLERLLNVLSHMKLLEKITLESKTLYKNTEETETYMTTNSPYSLLKLTDAARHTFDIADLIKKGKQDDSRNWFSDVEESNKAYQEIPFRFNRYYQKQDAYSRTCIHLLKAFDLSEFKTTVDLGGGVGSVCRALKQFYPDMSVTNLDMPSVVEYAKKKEEETGASKLNYVAADVFSDDPLPKADLYILGHFLHMFNEEVCDQVLKRISQFLNPGGAILVLEKVMYDQREGPELCLMYDIRMGLSSGRGRERTKAQYAAMMKSAGFGKPKFYEDVGYSCYDAILARKMD